MVYNVNPHVPYTVVGVNAARMLAELQPCRSAGLGASNRITLVNLPNIQHNYGHVTIRKYSMPRQPCRSVGGPEVDGNALGIAGYSLGAGYGGAGLTPAP